MSSVDGGELVLGQQVAAGVVDADLVGDGARRRPVVAGEHHRDHAERMEVADRLGAVAAHGVGHAEHAQRLALGDEHYGRLAFPLQALEHFFDVRTADGEFLHQAVVADVVQLPRHCALRSPAGQRFEGVNVQQGPPGFLPGGNDCGGDRVLGMGIDAGGELQQLVGRPGVQPHHVGQLPAARG
jgi:hypothetical protein